MVDIFYKKTAADNEMEALITRIKTSQRNFTNRTDKLVRSIDNNLTIARHMGKVMQHGIASDVVQGLKKISSAADGIVFPEDIVSGHKRHA